MPEKNITEIITVLLAFFGGMARYMKNILEGKEFKWYRMIAHLVIGGFTGISMAKFGTLLGLNNDAQHLFAAWGGVIGLQAFEFVTAFINKKIG